MSVTLTDEQRAVVENRGGELLVSAAAGSGKTRVLVERLLRRVTEEGCNVTDFLVITYTRAAAAELRGKILDAIRERLAETPDDRHLRRQMNLVYQAQISTIHAFCSALLRENGHLLELDPDFRIAEESEVELLRLTVLERVLEQRYAEIDRNGFATLVDTFSAGRDDSRLKTIVLDIQGRIQSHPNPERWLWEQAAAFDLRGIKDVSETTWGRLLLEDSVELAEYWFSQLTPTLDWMEEDPVTQRNFGDSIRATMDSLDNFVSAAGHGWDRAAALAEIDFPKVGTARKNIIPEIRDRVKAVRDRAKKGLAPLADRFSASSAELIAEMEETRPAVEQLVSLELDYLEAFQKEKKRRKLVDFGDLEHLALHALVGADGTPTPLAREWQSRYREVLVDEYQDTNEVQNAIFDAITGGGENLFQVGDIKQSIYRFRLADPRIFLRKYHSFSDAAQAGEHEPRRLMLTRNFRSRASVLEGVNFVFSHIMSSGFGDVDYVGDQKLVPALPYPAYDGDRVELDVLDLAARPQEEHEAQEPNALSEARFVAERIRALLDKPYLVTDGNGLRPVRPGDIAVLHRSLNQVLPYLTEALDERNIPWQSASEEDLFSASEVQMAFAFLEVVNNPREDVPLLSVLRSPVYAFTPDELAALRVDRRTGDLFTCVQASAEAGNQRCAGVLEDLRVLRSLAPDTDCVGILWQIYDRLGLYGLVGAMPGGQRRQENLLAFYEFTRSYEIGEHRGLFSYVTRLRKLLNSGARRPAGQKKAGTGVQLMTIHRSKGLEFPVVVLAGLGKGLNLSDQNKPMLFHPTLGIGPRARNRKLRLEYPTLARSAIRLRLEQENKSEELRLLYVAMTRAREKLILSLALPNAQRTLEQLLPMAGPHPHKRALLGLDSMGKWLLLPVLARRDASALWLTARPERFVNTIDSWEINLIPLGEPDEAAEAQPTPGAAEAQAEAPSLTEEQLSLLTWRYPWERLATLPSKVTATQLKGRRLDEEVAEDAVPPKKPMTFRRPDFEQRARGLTPAERGTATHAVMQLIVPDRATTAAGVAGELHRLTESGFLTEMQARAVSPARIAAFWASPLGREAAASPRLEREYKFSILTNARRCFADAPEGEQVLLQGVIDCFFASEDGWTVIDFKTDRLRPGEEQARAEEYRTQVEAYSSALEEITGRPVMRRVLWFFATGTAVFL